ncbi:MAG: CPBP family intramembrane glutamic endopeptidase [Acidobacteriota bacterium]
MTDKNTSLAREAVYGFIYFSGYLGYLFYRRETELAHWLSLVLIPFFLILWHQRSKNSVSESLASIGLMRGNLKKGLWWACLLGLVLSALQLFLSRRAGAILQLIYSGKAAWLFPMVLILMLVTAGFTEEFFFRGVLQTRFEKLFRNRFLAVVAASILFGLYHLPYAYLNPRWPSFGNWSDALASAMGQGVPAGLILGAVYARTRNLFVPVIVHSLINTLPAMTMMKFGEQ